MYSLDKFRKLIIRKKEARFRLLKREIRHLKRDIEKVLTLFFESTTSRAQRDFTELQVY